MMVWFYLFYLTFFIVVIVYASLSGAAVRQSFCYFSQVPVLALNGFKAGSDQFVGFVGIENLMTNFSSQVLGLGNFTGNLSSIQGQNLQTTGAATAQAASDISTFYPDKNILDAKQTNSYSYPDLFVEMDSNYMPKIDKQFKNISSLAIKTNTMAVNA